MFINEVAFFYRFPIDGLITLNIAKSQDRKVTVASDESAQSSRAGRSVSDYFG